MSSLTCTAFCVERLKERAKRIQQTALKNAEWAIAAADKTNGCSLLSLSENMEQALHGFTNEPDSSDTAVQEAEKHGPLNMCSTFVAPASESDNDELTRHGRTLFALSWGGFLCEGDGLFRKVYFANTFPIDNFFDHIFVNFRRVFSLRRSLRHWELMISLQFLYPSITFFKRGAWLRGKWEWISLLLHHNCASHSGAMQNVIDLFEAEAAWFVTFGEKCMASTCEDVCSEEGYQFAKGTVEKTWRNFREKMPWGSCGKIGYVLLLTVAGLAVEEKDIGNTRVHAGT